VGGDPPDALRAGALDQGCEVIVTAPDADWLADLCHQLVDARLAASAHVVHPVTSIYRWRGSVHTTPEARAFLRSRRALLDELVAYVVARHPYEVPNITALPLVGGTPTISLGCPPRQTQARSPHHDPARGRRCVAAHAFEAT
jgi:periplasmic divalent cation tolerance protein